MYVYNSDVVAGNPVKFPIPSRIPGSSGIVINGLAAALGGAPTADFRVTMLGDSTIPGGDEMDLSVQVRAADTSNILELHYIDDGGRLVGGDSAFGNGSTADGLTLDMYVNEVGDDNGWLCCFLEVDSGSGFVSLGSLPGVTYIDTYGNNPVSNGGAGDQPYYTVANATPVTDFWTDLVNCIE